MPARTSNAGPRVQSPPRENVSNQVRDLFRPEQWERLQQDPFQRWPDHEWQALSDVQRQAVFDLRNERRQQTGGRNRRNDEFRSTGERRNENVLRGELPGGGTRVVGQDPISGGAARQSGPQSLFTPEQWQRLEADPYYRWPPQEWESFTPAQRQAIIDLRGARGPNAGKSLEEVLRECQSAPPHPRVKLPWDAVPPGRMMVHEMNVENMMRESDAPGKRDEEFTPQAGYTQEIFYEHLRNIGQVIKSVNGGQGAHIVPLIEVEDLKAAQKLIDRELQGLGYQAHLIEGEDGRGIDVALLTKYPLWPGTMPDLLLSDQLQGERGILKVHLNAEGKHVVVYVNHWKSMRDGESEAARQNSIMARMLREDIARTTQADPNVKVIVTGDFNTKYYHGDQRAMDALGVSRDSSSMNGPADLWDATSTIPKRREEGVQHPLLPDGTHTYRGEGDFLDRIMVNKNAKLDADSVVVIPNAGRFFDRDNRPRPGGVSDHKSMVAQFDLAD